MGVDTERIIKCDNLTRLRIHLTLSLRAEMERLVQPERRCDIPQLRKRYERHGIKGRTGLRWTMGRYVLGVRRRLGLRFRR